MPIFHATSASFQNLLVTGSTSFVSSNDTIIPLQLKGTGSIILSVSGSSGGLFSISDNITDNNLFSVSYGSNKVFDIKSTKDITVSGSLYVTSSVYIPSLTTESKKWVITYDTASGKLHYTASSAIGGGGGTGTVGPGTQNYIAFFSGSTTTISSSVIYQSGSNIGIGTTTASYKLDVSGSGNFTNGLTVTGSFTVVSASTEFRVLDTGIKIGNSGSDSHQITGSVLITGSVGIGTSTSSYILDVSGSGRFTGNLIISGSVITPPLGPNTTGSFSTTSSLGVAGLQGGQTYTDLLLITGSGGKIFSIDLSDVVSTNISIKPNNTGFQVPTLEISSSYNNMIRSGLYASMSIKQWGEFVVDQWGIYADDAAPNIFTVKNSNNSINIIKTTTNKSGSSFTYNITTIKDIITLPPMAALPTASTAGVYYSVQTGSIATSGSGTGFGVYVYTGGGTNGWQKLAFT